MALLTVKELKTWYAVRSSLFGRTDYVRAVDGVSFSLDEGECLGLVGESGCGKSTLGRSIVRLENPTHGEITLLDYDICSLKGRKLKQARSDFQMIFQDPYGSLNPRMTVRKALDEVVSLHTRLDKCSRIARIVKLLEMVGLKADHMDRYPHQFSGGQRQRIGIARALAVEPKLIIADEPVSALDVSVQAQIINLLKDIQQQTKIAYLFIAHDLAVVENISNRILVMYLGKIVESGFSAEICANPVHPYTRALISAVPSLDPGTKRKRIILAGDVPSPLDPPRGCPFHPRCSFAREQCNSQAPQLKPVGKDDNHLASCFFADEI